MTISLIRQFRPPALPEWPKDYTGGFGSGYNRVLRLYFNDLANSISVLAGYGTHGSFYSTVTQTNPVASTANLVTVNSTTHATNTYFDVAHPSRIYVEYTGVYNIQFSLQLDKSGGSATSVYIWLRINGVDVPNSASVVVINGPNAQIVPSWNFMEDMNAGDYFEVVWSSADTAVIIPAITAAAPVPAIPSAIITVAYQSPLDRT